MTNLETQIINVMNQHAASPHRVWVIARDLLVYHDTIATDVQVNRACSGLMADGKLDNTSNFGDQIPNRTFRLV